MAVPFTEEELDDIYGTTGDEPPMGPAFDRATKKDPDTEAKVQQISEDRGVDPMTIRNNLPEFERQERVRTTDFDDLNRSAPTVADWMSDPQNADLASDDVETLKRIETESQKSYNMLDMLTMNPKDTTSWWAQLFAGFGRQKALEMRKYGTELGLFFSELEPMKPPREQFAQNVLNAMEESGKGDTEFATDIRETLAENEDIRQRNYERRKVDAERYLAEIDVAQQEIGRMQPEDLDLLQEGIRSGFSSAFDSAMGLMVSLATRGAVNPTLPYLTSKTSLDAYGSAAIENPNLTPEERRRYAALQGIVEYGTEKIPMKQLEKIFGEIGQEGIKSSFKRFILGEALGEQFATGLQSWIDYGYELDQEMAALMDKDDYLGAAELQITRHFVTLVATAVTTGTLSGTAKGLDAIVNRQRNIERRMYQNMDTRMRMEFEQNKIQKYMYLAQESNLNARAGKRFQELVDAIPNDQMIYIDREELTELGQAPQFIREAGEMDKDNPDIEMSLGTFLKNSRDLELDELSKLVRLDKDSSSQYQIANQGEDQTLKRLFEEARKDEQASFEIDQIYDQVVDQIIWTGRQQEGTARQSAEVIRAYLKTAYIRRKKSGMKDDAKTFFSKLGLKVIGPKESPVGDYFTEQARTEREQAEEKGLDVSPQAVMARAKELGFDTDQKWYHGTYAHIAAFYEPDDNDLGIHLGNTKQASDRIMRRSKGGYQNFYSVGDPDGQRVMPVYIRAKNPVRMPDTGTWDDVTWMLDELYGSYQITDEQYRNAWASARTAGDLRGWLIQWGFDSVLYENRYEGTTGGVRRESSGDSIIILDPKNIRSTSAVFDPDFTDSPNIMAQAARGQDFGDMELAFTGEDDAGNRERMSIPANELWNYHQDRLDVVELLRGCMNG